MAKMEYMVLTLEAAAV